MQRDTIDNVAKGRRMILGTTYCFRDRAQKTSPSFPRGDVLWLSFGNRIPIGCGEIAHVPEGNAFEAVDFGEPDFFGDALRVFIIDFVRSDAILVMDQLQEIRHAPGFGSIRIRDAFFHQINARPGHRRFAIRCDPLVRLLGNA
jgi:hypothetical protein